MDRAVDVRLLLERLVPRRVGPGGGGPGPARDGLDDLNRDVPLPADAQHFLEVSPVALLLGHEEVIGQEHGVEVEPCEAPPVHGGDGPAVTGHADEACESFLTGLDQRLERAAGPHGLIPVVGMTEGVQLDQVDVIDAQPLERAMEVLARLGRGPAAGLRREKARSSATRRSATPARTRPAPATPRPSFERPAPAGSFPERASYQALARLQSSR